MSARHVTACAGQVIVCECTYKGAHDRLPNAPTLCCTAHQHHKMRFSFVSSSKMMLLFEAKEVL